MTQTNEYIHRTDAFMGSLGVEAWRVGGSVRDEILGRRVKDADYMVRGIDLETLGGRLRFAAGPYKHATKVSVLQDRDRRQMGWRVAAPGLGMVEITLPRKEISTGPGHRDFDIVLDPALPLHEDAKRRDFTFNALYRQITPEGPGQIADPTNRGLHDLQHKLIQTTHPDSFRDDPLRVLRALRFISVLGYNLTLETGLQMHEHADAVTGLTAPVVETTKMDGTEIKHGGGTSGTVLDEMSKLLMGDDVAEALRVAASTGVLGVLFPELAPMIGFQQESRYHDMTTDQHTFKALETAAKVDAPLRVRWALLFHDSGKPATAWRGEDGKLHYYKAKDHTSEDNIDPFDGHVQMDHEEYGEILWREAAARINAPRDLREGGATLIRNHMVAASGKVKAAKVRRDRVRLGDEMLRDLHMHRMCDLTGKSKANRGQLLHLAQREDARRAAERAGIPAAIKDLQISGRDAMELGLRGPDIGKALAAVLDEVVTEPGERKLTREWQLERLGRVV